MKKLYYFLCGMLLLSSPVAAQIGSSCDGFADTMTKSVISIFHDTSQSEQQKRQALSGLFQEAVDTDWIGKFVLGRFWKNATDEEKRQYLEKYRAYLTRNYVSKFDDDTGLSVDDIKLTSITPSGSNQFEAKSLIKRKGEEDVHADYLLDGSSSKCQVHDIKIEGVSLLATQRSEFQTLAG
jgi:phospholipid transport system substrate-binding protein